MDQTAIFKNECQKLGWTMNLDQFPDPRNMSDDHVLEFAEHLFVVGHYGASWYYSGHAVAKGMYSGIQDYMDRARGVYDAAQEFLELYEHEKENTKNLGQRFGFDIM